MICLFVLASLATDVAGLAEARAPILDVAALLPAVDTNVPINGRLVFVGAADATFVRVQAGEGGAVVDEVALADHTTLPVDQFEVVHVVGLPAELGLAIGEQLIVQSRCGGCSFQGTWTVVDEDTTPPVFADGPARVTAEHIDPAFGGTSGGYFITVELPGAQDESSATMIELRGDINQAARQSFAQGAPMDIFVTSLDDSERTACFDAIAIDAAGNETVFGEELCVELVHPFIGGCAQTTTSASATFALALVALLVRRRVRAFSWRRQ